MIPLFCVDTPFGPWALYPIRGTNGPWRVRLCWPEHSSSNPTLEPQWSYWLGVLCPLDKNPMHIGDRQFRKTLMFINTIRQIQSHCALRSVLENQWQPHKRLCTWTLNQFNTLDIWRCDLSLARLQCRGAASWRTATAHLQRGLWVNVVKFASCSKALGVSDRSIDVIWISKGFIYSATWYRTIIPWHPWPMTKQMDTATRLCIHVTQQLSAPASQQHSLAAVVAVITPESTCQRGQHWVKHQSIRIPIPIHPECCPRYV